MALVRFRRTGRRRPHGGRLPDQPIAALMLAERRLLPDGRWAHDAWAVIGDLDVELPSLEETHGDPIAR